MMGSHIIRNATTGCLILCFLASHAVGQVAPGAKTAMQEAMLGEAAFRLRLHAPVESVQDVLDSLDALLKIEEAVRRGDEELYVSQKQRLLQIHKNRIREIVRTAFEVVHASVVNPVQFAVKSGLASSLSSATLRMTTSVASVTASLRKGGYAATVGGGSTADTLWIDLMSVPEIATTDPELTELRKIYDATEMGFKIEQSRHITVFMPNNAAIRKQLAPVMAALSYADLIEIFQGHILPEVVKASELNRGSRKTMTTMADSEVSIIREHDTQQRRVSVYVDGSTLPAAVVQGKEIDNANGIAYVIDRVLLSPKMEQRIEEAFRQVSHGNTASQLPAVPEHIEETNLHHWFYGRYGGAPVATSGKTSDHPDASTPRATAVPAMHPTSSKPSSIAVLRTPTRDSRTQSVRCISHVVPSLSQMRVGVLA